MKKLLIAIPFLFLAAACNKQTSRVQPAQTSQPIQASSSAQTQQQPQATSTVDTTNWKTFTSNFGYLVKYPDGWTIQDLSYAYKGNNSIGFWIFGPQRSGLPGATGKAFFAEQGCYDTQQLKFTDYCYQSQGEVISFDYPQKPGDQAVNFVSLDASYIKSTPEYQTAQIILSTAKIENSATSDWKTYNNDKYGYQVMFPSDSVLATEDLSLGAAGHKIVENFPPNEPFITISEGSAYVSICNDCGDYGLGMTDKKSAELINVNGTELNASGFISSDSDGNSEIYFVDFLGSTPNVSIRYGYQSDYGKPLEQGEIDSANKFVHQILSTFKLTN
jgi:hypothetical protein